MVGVYTHTPIVSTLIIHVEVWVVDSVYCGVFTQGGQEFTSASVRVKKKSHQTGVPQTGVGTLTQGHHSVGTLTQGHHRTC